MRKGGGVEEREREGGGGETRELLQEHHLDNFSAIYVCMRNAHGWFCGQGMLCRQRTYPSVVVT